MNPDSATTTSTASTPALQVQASAPKAAPQAPAAPVPLTPVQLFWEVATLAFELMRRLVSVLQPIQPRFPKQAWQLARLLIDIPRLLLTIRYVPERITQAQLRHLTRARHVLKALFNYTLPPLGARTSRPPQANAGQSPSASTDSPSATPPGACTPSSSVTSPSPIAPAVRETPAVAGVRQAPGIAPVREVSEIPLVAGLHPRKTPSAASAQTQSPSPAPSPTLNSEQLADNNPHASQSPHSAFSPYIPDFHTLAQALKADSLPPNCAGALFDEPGDALVKILNQLHFIYFSLYPTQSPSPSPSPSQSPSNLQSTIFNQQSGNRQSAAPSVHSVHSPSQSEISNLKSAIPNPQSAIYNPQSNAPP